MSGPYGPFPPQQGQTGGQSGPAGYGQSGGPAAYGPGAYSHPGYGYPGGYGQPGYNAGAGAMPGYPPTPGVQRDYLQGGPVGFGSAIAEAFRNVVTFSGRASLSAFWWFVLFCVIVYLGLGIGVGMLLSAESVSANAPLAVVAIVGIIEVVLFLLSLSLQIRRLHDGGRSGFWWFLGLIPLVGGIILLVFFCLPGTPGPNQYD